MIFPKPKSEKYIEGTYDFSKVSPEKSLVDFYRKSDAMGIAFSKNADFANEEYTIEIGEGGVAVTYAADEGKFRALTSLRQLVKKNNGVLPFCKISDKPDIDRRSYMLDISRGRVPKLKTILDYIDVLAEMKYNEFQLYMDNFCFKYAAFPEYTKDFDCLTPEDIKTIDQYCADRFMDLVPNQNSFGHMKAWVDQPELRHLALGNDKQITWSLNPLDDGSVELMDKIYGSLLPHFRSKYVNIGLDEATGLGKFQTEQACKERGVADVFVSYLTKLNKIVNEKYGKEVHFWADMIINYPEAFEKFPKNVTAVEWGYGMIATQVMEERVRTLKEKGIRFYIAPGNLTWGGIASRVEIMEFNVRTTGELAKKYGAAGYMLTDWSNPHEGHPQYLVQSYFPAAMAAQYGWNSGTPQVGATLNLFKHEFRYGAMEYLDENVFGCKGVTELLYRLGRYDLYEPHVTHGMSMIAHATMIPLSKMRPNDTVDAVNVYDHAMCGDTSFYFRNTINYLYDVRKDIAAAEFDERLKREALVNTDMLILGAELCMIKTTQKLTEEKRQELFTLIDSIRAEHKDLWMYRNFENGFAIYDNHMINRKAEIAAFVSAE